MAENSRRRPQWQPPTTRSADDVNLQSAREAVQHYTFQQSTHKNGPAAKRARFDTRNPSRLAAPEEDETNGETGRGDDDDYDLDLDEIGRKGIQGKRTGVELDGYDTDSSDDNFDSRAQDRAQLKKELEREAALERTSGKSGSKAGHKGDQADEDMFADSGSDGEDEDGSEVEDSSRRKDKRTVEFLDLKDIEGEESKSRGGGHVSLKSSEPGSKRAQPQWDGEESEDDSSGSGDDEARARLDGVVDEELGAGSKKKNAPRLDAFNMKAEQQEGRFDTDGNFIRNAADPEAEHDNWLDGVSRKDIRRAREAEEQRIKATQQREEADWDTTTVDLLAVLIRTLQKSDTVLETLGRLGQQKAQLQPKSTKPGKGKNSAKRSKLRTGEEGDVEMDPVDPQSCENPHEPKIRHLVVTIQQVTEAADRLLGRGVTDVYDTPREALMRLYRRESGQDWDEPEGESKGDSDGDEQVLWKFRWIEGPSAGQVHGPYDTVTMNSWAQAGYFANPEAVEFARVKPGEADDWAKDISDFEVAG